MTHVGPPAEEVVAAVRAALAEGPTHQLAVLVDVDGDAVVLRGTVGSEPERAAVIDQVRHTLAGVGDAPGGSGPGLQLLDELHVLVMQHRDPEDLR